MGTLRPSRQESRREPAPPPWVLPAIWGLGIHRRRSRDPRCMGRRRSEARSMMPVEKVLDKLDGTRESNGSWKALCPAHEDREPSLSVAEGDDGRALLKCFAGCDTENIVGALGLEMKDLFEQPNGHK